MNRRALIKALGSVVLLTGGLVSPVVFSQNAPKLLVPPEITSPLFHVFGTLPEPVEIKRIFAINASASVLVNSVAPKQLLGWSFEPSADALPWLSQFSRALPVVRDLDTESLVALKPNIIVDVAEVNEQSLAQAKQIHEDTGVTYVLVGGRIEDMPEQVRTLGAILGHQRHGQQLAAVAKEVLDDVAAKRAAFKGNTPTITVVRSVKGVETAIEGADLNEIMHLVGAKNVADSERVVVVPDVPFGWLDDPLSINRLLGLLWLSAWLHDEEQSVLIDKLRHVFILYFAYDPGPLRLQELLNNPAVFAD